MVVTEDAQTITNSENLSFSRTCIDTNGQDVAGPDLTMSGLKAPASGKQWYFLTAAGSQPVSYASGSVTLPTGSWRQGELSYE